MLKKISVLLIILFTGALFFGLVGVGAPAEALEVPKGLAGASKNLTELSGTGLSGNIQDPIIQITRAILALVGTLFLLLTVYAGILWMTAAGTEEKITKAQTILKAAVIGIIITVSAYAITSFVVGRVNNSGGSESGDRGGCCSLVGSTTSCADVDSEESCNSRASDDPDIRSHTFEAGKTCDSTTKRCVEE